MAALEMRLDKFLWFARLTKTRRLAQEIVAAGHLRIDGRSGCSDFVGTVTVEGGGDARLIEFAWDCRWRAEQQGWVDAYGFPDQIRAADEFGWNCFHRWQLNVAKSA